MMSANKYNIYKRVKRRVGATELKLFWKYFSSHCRSQNNAAYFKKIVENNTYVNVISNNYITPPVFSFSVTTGLLGLLLLPSKPSLV